MRGKESQEALQSAGGLSINTTGDAETVMTSIVFFPPPLILKKMLVIQLQLYAFSPHPSTPPKANPPPSPTLKDSS